MRHAKKLHETTKTPHSATGGVRVDETRYTLRLTPPLDASLTKMAQRMDLDKGKVISEALILLAAAMENKRRGGGGVALLDKSGLILRVLPIIDNGQSGDLEIVRETDEAE